MKRANGYGTITKLSGKRRKPYAVRVIDMKASLTPNSDGTYSYKQKYIGYFATLSEASKCLMDYNIKHIGKTATETNYNNITVKEIYKLWSARNLSNAKASRLNSYNTGFKNMQAIHNKKIRELRLRDLQAVIDAQTFTSLSSLNNIKKTMNAIFEWAIQNDVIEKNYVTYVKINGDKEKNHQPLTHKEVDGLWESDTEIAHIILIYCYTGIRPNELLSLKREQIKVEDRYFKITEAKTKSGVRTVPVADKILPYFTDFVNNKLGEYSYPQYLADFKAFLPNHTPHDTRSTFISFATEKGISKTIIQKIVGHKAGDITTDVYTHLSLQPLLDAVNKL